MKESPRSRAAEAQAVYHRGLEIRLRRLGPGDLQLAANFVSIASTLDRQQRFEDAAAELRKALSMLGKALGTHHPDLVPLLIRQRSAYMQMGKQAEAGIFYDRELEIRAAAHDELMKLQVPVAGDRGGDALVEFAEAVRLQPDSVVMRSNLADALTKGERFAEAEEHYRKTVEMAPNNAALRSKLAIVLLKQGFREDAVAEFRRALAIDPHLREAREGLQIAERKESSGDTGGSK